MTEERQPILLAYARPERLRLTPILMSTACALAALAISGATFSLMIPRSFGWYVRLAAPCVGAALGVVGLAVSLSVCFRSTVSRRGRAIRAFGLIPVTFSLFGVVLSVATVTSRGYWTDPVPRKRSPCARNLRTILQACKLYAYEDEHGGWFPPNLDVLVAAAEISAKQLRCPKNPKSRYVYIPGLGEDSSANTPVVYELLGNHDVGGNIGFADGHVEFVTQPRYDQILAPYLGRTPTSPDGSAMTR